MYISKKQTHMIRNQTPSDMHYSSVDVRSEFEINHHSILVKIVNPNLFARKM